MRRLFVTGLASAAVLFGVVSTHPAVTMAEENAREDGSVEYALVASADSFRDYIDNDGVYASQDSIETKWSGYTDVHKVVVKESGTLLIAALAGSNEVNMELFGNFALTAKIGESQKTITSDREGIGYWEVDAGTYYYRGSRWNGYEVPFVVTTYVGFIPEDKTSLGNAANVYDTSATGAVPVNEIPVVQSEDGLKEYVMGDGQFAWQDNIETKWSGSTEAYSFSVAEDGWLFVYPVAEDDNVYWKLYSNKDLTSCIVKEKTRKNVDSTPYSVYLKAGTYYCRGERWNGYKVPYTVTTYLGFMPAFLRISVQDINYSADETEATVTFSYDQEYFPSFQSGTMRVVEGTVHPRDVFNGDVWKTSAKENALESASVVVKKNGDYTVRIANSDAGECFCMAYFSIDGLKKPDSDPGISQGGTNKPAVPVITVAKRGKKIVKGTADAYLRITVKVAGKEYSTISGSKGHWSVKLSKKLKKGNVVKAWVTNSMSVRSKVVSYKVK